MADQLRKPPNKDQYVWSSEPDPGHQTWHTVMNISDLNQMKGSPHRVWKQSSVIRGASEAGANIIISEELLYFAVWLIPGDERLLFTDWMTPWL